MQEGRVGVLSGLSAYLLWGVFPLYFRLLEPAGGVEIVAHRIVWSVVFVALLLTVLRRWSHVPPAIADRRTLLVLSGAAVLIAVNWLVYVLAVNSGHVVEASLGYFINPLVSVLLGVVFFAERLRPLQWVAVGIATLAVAVLTVDFGRPPWIALVLAASFGLYGLMKKLVRVEAAPGLFVETVVLLLPATAFLVVLQARGEGTVGSEGAGHALLLLSTGVATAIPLLLFAAATRRIPLSTVGLLQYVTPLMQLALGVFVFHEPMPPARLVGFVIVWGRWRCSAWTASGRPARRPVAVLPTRCPRPPDRAPERRYPGLPSFASRSFPARTNRRTSDAPRTSSRGLPAGGRGNPSRGPGAGCRTAPRAPRPGAHPARARDAGLRATVVAPRRREGDRHPRALRPGPDALLPVAERAGRPTRGTGRRPPADPSAPAPARRARTASFVAPAGK